MYESISKNNELENEVSSDMSYFWYSDDIQKQLWCILPFILKKNHWFASCLNPLPQPLYRFPLLLGRIIIFAWGCQFLL